MIAYSLWRVSQGLLVVLGVTVIVFVLVHLLPGGPGALLGERATPEQIKAFLQANGYDKPIYEQYINYLRQLLHGDLGYSYLHNATVSSLLAQNLPKSALLVGLSYIVALAVAIPFGLMQALRRNRAVDYVLTGLSLVGYSMPVFWIALVLISLFAINYNILPPVGPSGATVSEVVQQPANLVLPVLTLSVVTVAQFSRFVRSSAIDVLVQDYVRTARSKGISEWHVVSRHVVRNSLLPIITLIGLSLPGTLSGAVVTESVFNYPGMGLLFWNAAAAHDIPVLLGFTLVVSVSVVVGSMVADVLYAVCDPRIR